MASSSKPLASTGLVLVLFTLLSFIPSYSALSRILTAYNSDSASASAASWKDSIKLDLCVELLKDLAKVEVGNPDHPCCSLLGDLVKLQGRACVCTTLNLNVLNLIRLNTPLNLNMLLDTCKSKLPPYFQSA